MAKEETGRYRWKIEDDIDRKTHKTHKIDKIDSTKTGKGGTTPAPVGLPDQVLVYDLAAPAVPLDLSKLVKLDLSPRGLKLDLSELEGLSKNVQEAFNAVEDTGLPVEHLVLCGANLGPNGVQMVSSLLEAHSALQVLNLGMNYCKAEGATELALALRLETARKLRDLDISGNDIGLDGVAAICGNLLSTSSLRTLRLQNNNLAADSALVLGELLERLPLRELWLDENRLGPTGAKNLARGLKSAAVKLDTLSLHGNGITDAGLAALAEPLRSNATLKQLLLGSGNHIKGDGLEALAASIGSNSRSQVSTIVVDEPSARIVARVRLLFAFKRVATKTDRGLWANFGSLLRSDGKKLGALSHTIAALEPEKCRVFFASPLTYWYSTPHKTLTLAHAMPLI